MESTIKIQDASRMVACKDDMYYAMIRNRFYLPSKKYTIISVYWMKLVRQKKIWMPNFEEIRLMPCPFPPIGNSIL